MTQPDASGLDDLITALKRRAADPERRVDQRQTAFGAQVSGMSLSDMFGQIASLRSDLGRVLDANRAGRIDPDATARAEQLAQSMSTPIAADLPPPADAATLDRAEADLGRPLPVVLRRVYAEVADGGFGPGDGLMSIEAAVATYRDLFVHSPAPRGRSWPAGMLPLVNVNPGYWCIDLEDGRIVDWDPEETSEWQGPKGWARSFKELAPGLDAWLAEWLSSKTPQELAAEQATASMASWELKGARESRAAIRAMTPAQRAEMGLPEQGWEEIVWGGIGWDPVNKREID